jgi:hypothetical protein
LLCVILVLAVIAGIVRFHDIGGFILLRAYWDEVFNHIAAPFEAPIDLTHKGVLLDANFYVRIPCGYPLVLDYHPDGKSYRELIPFMGRLSHHKSPYFEPITVTIEGLDVENKDILFRKTSNILSVNIWVPDKHYVNSLAYAYLKAGHYRVRLETQNDVFMLKEIKAIFRVSDVVARCPFSKEIEAMAISDQSKETNLKGME